MRHRLLILFLLLLLGACASEPTPAQINAPARHQSDGPAAATQTLNPEAPLPSPPELIVVGQLINIDHTPYCGMLHFGARAEYADLTVLRGEYASDMIVVVHGCPEMPRSDYATGSGNLEAFNVGEYHELHLTTRNVYHIEVILNNPAPPPESTYFCQVVNAYSK